MGEGTAWWFGASGFEVLTAVHGEAEIEIEVQSTATAVGCHGCGVRATPKDRRWVTVRDAPAGNLAVVVRWRKRIWACKDTDCVVKTWTEQADWAAPRQSLSVAAQRWATDRIEAVEGTPASIARQFGVSWSTVWAVVERIARARVDNADRVGPVAMVGFDETVMQPASRRRRRRFITAVVDVTTGQILDVFEGHDAQHLRAWMVEMPAEWLAQIEVESVDPHEGYRSALTNPDPLTAAVSPLAGAVMVVDPFHIVRLANAAVTRCRTRVQRETLEHRAGKATRSTTSASSC